jgi:triacylglycerol esterase/lipase EstA (alpha/beta hydrolase family)
MGEVWWSGLTFGWRQAFRVWAEPDNLPPESSGRRGVVLVHGFVCNRGLWNPWMRRLRGEGVPFIAVNLTPLFGDIDGYAAQIEAAVSRLSALGEPPLIVGHSMGGLAARAWLQRFGSPGRCAGIVTIGTPHHGTWLARFAFSHNGRQMRRDGAWLSALNERVVATSDVPFECYFSNCDNIVFPAWTAALPGADNVHLDGWAHVHMLGSPLLVRRVMARLNASPASVGGCRSGE